MRWLRRRPSPTIPPQPRPSSHLVLLSRLSDTESLVSSYFQTLNFSDSDGIGAGLLRDISLQHHPHANIPLEAVDPVYPSNQTRPLHRTEKSGLEGGFTIQSAASQSQLLQKLDCPGPHTEEPPPLPDPPLSRPHHRQDLHSCESVQSGMSESVISLLGFLAERHAQDDLPDQTRAGCQSPMSEVTPCIGTGRWMMSTKSYDDLSELFEVSRAHLDFDYTQSLGVSLSKGGVLPP